MQKRRVTLFPEFMVQFRVHTAHGFHHLFAELHGRRERLRISTQDVSEVYVE